MTKKCNILSMVIEICNHTRDVGGIKKLACCNKELFVCVIPFSIYLKAQCLLFVLYYSHLNCFVFVMFGNFSTKIETYKFFFDKLFGRVLKQDILLHFH